MGPIWYTKKEVFNDNWNSINNTKLSKHDLLNIETSKICKNQHEEFIRHYNDNYNNPKTPPSWMILECLSFGTCNNIFRHLANRQDKKNISNLFGESPHVITSWLESIRYTRNICAHHSRLWNRKFVFEPIRSHSISNIETTQHSFHQRAIILYKLNNHLSPGSTWREKLFDLFEEHSNNLPFDKMGFNKDWEKDKFWSL